MYPGTLTVPTTTTPGGDPVALTVPTYDLVGLLNDVIPFASTDKAITSTHAVLVEWDGDQLHAYATNRFVAGWSRWTPGDDAPEDPDPDQDALFGDYGGDDAPWRVLLHLQVAKHIAASFKLAGGAGWQPLTVEKYGDELRIRRDRDQGLPALKYNAPGVLTATFPSLRKELQRVVDEVTVPPGTTRPGVDKVAVSADLLAKFGKVRDYGPLQLWFRDRTGLVLVRCGDRFTGGIAPVRMYEWDPRDDRPGTRDTHEQDVITTEPTDDRIPTPPDPDLTLDGDRAGDTD
jgi:hypothetical protein